MMQAKIFSTLLFGLAMLWNSLALADVPASSPIWPILESAAENSWVRVNLNEFQDVWTPLGQRPAPPSAPTVGNPSKIIRAWSSFAWDSNQGDLIFYGGGHANYPGNEIYRWQTSTLDWQRASLPSELFDVGSKGRFTPVDGMLNAPPAAHTYDNTGFLAVANRYYTFGGAAFNSGRYYEFPDGSRTGPYFWDPSKADAGKVGGTTGSHVNPTNYPGVLGGEMWDNRNNLEPQFSGDPRPGKYFINTTTAAAVENGKDVVYIQNGNSVYKYTVNDVNDAGLDTYQRVGARVESFNGQGAGAIDPDRELYVRSVQRIRFGAGSSVIIDPPTFVYWDLDSASGSIAQSRNFMPLMPEEQFDMDMFWAYGMDFDKNRGTFTMWGGQGDVWELIAPADLENGDWILKPRLLDGVSAQEPQTPGWAGGFRGVIGSWKYAEQLDVYFGVTDGFSGDIWVYKPSNWSPNAGTGGNQPPSVSLTAPANGSIVAFGQDLPIVADASDSDGSIASVSFYNGSELLATVNAAPFSYPWPQPAVGSYSLTAEATDNEGATTVSAAVSVTVTDGNIPPSVNLTTPADGSSVAYGEDITIAADASDTDGNVVGVAFYNGVQLLATVNAAPYSYLWSLPDPGDYQITAQATDNDGGVTSSAVVNVSVVDTNVAPSVSLDNPLEGEVFAPGDVVNLVAQAADADGNLASVAFHVNGNLVGQANMAPYELQWTVPATGIFVLTAVATDTGNASTTSTPITVSAYSGEGGSVLLQDGLNGYSGTRDAYLYRYRVDKNYGTKTDLRVKISPEIQKSDTLIRFAVFQSEGGPVPDGVVIDSATLSLYKSSNRAESFSTQAVLADWQETLVTWNESSNGVAWQGDGPSVIGVDIAASVDGEAYVDTVPQWLALDVTNSLQAMSAGQANHGWKIAQVGSNGYLHKFYASEYSDDPALRPKLSISYSVAGNQSPEVSITAPADGGLVAYGENLLIQADAMDSDGSIASVSFYNGTELLATVNSAPFVHTMIFPDLGSYSLTAEAIDDEGAATVSAVVNVTVTDGNIPPTVNLITPADGSAVSLGDDVSITANAGDSDGSVASVAFYIDGQLLASVNTAPYSYLWSMPAEGDYQITAQATDNDGGVTISPLVNVSVVDTNMAPSVSISNPLEGDVFAPGDVVNLVAEAVDADGNLASVAFYENGILLGEVFTTPYAVQWTVPATGIFSLTAVARDDRDVSTTSAAVTVSAISGDGGSVVLQDGLNGYANTQDAYLYHYRADKNYGSKSDLRIKISPDLQKMDTLVRFAVFQSEGGPVPDGASIDSATLSLYKSSSRAESFTPQALLSDWRENEVSWNESTAGTPWQGDGPALIGGDIAAAVDGEAYVDTVPQWLNLDVSNSLQAMSDGQANYGWKLGQLGGAGYLHKFLAREHADDPTLRPKLSITYSTNAEN